MRSAFTGLAPWLAGQATIVASSPLLVSAIAGDYTGSRLVQGALTWERPNIVTLDNWLTNCWQEARFEGTDVPALLSRQQETFLWRSVIEETTPGLFDPEATALLARRAAQTIAEWNIPLDHEAWQEHEDGQQFLRWLKSIQRQCRERDWTTRADLWKAVPEWLRTGVCRTSSTAFAGFTSLFPALERITRLLPKHAVFGTAGTNPPAVAPAYPCESFEEELDLAARWARSKFEAAPESSIAVFVPDLASHRAAVERAWAQVFYPGAALGFHSDSTDSAFHIHASDSLLQHPLIAGACLILDLAGRRVDQACASSLLRSPFIAGAAEERSARALADLKLRRNRQLDVSLWELRRAVAECPLVLKSLAGFERTLSRMRPAQDLSGWGRYFADLLEPMGWPGDADLREAEQDVVECWKDSLSSLGTLGLVSKPVSFDTALDLLKRILKNAAGRERGDGFSPVQILDAGDAEGLAFDASFAVALSEESWPPAKSSSPLIPARLQRATGVPGSSPQSIFEERERKTCALFCAAPDAAASFTGSGAAVVRGFVEVRNTQPAVWTGRTPAESFPPAVMEAVEDTLAPPFSVEHAARGGTGIIKSQSQCPFKAFAEYRLKARSPEEGCFGFDALDRGKFVHRALELVWRQLKSQDRLKTIADYDLRGLIAGAVTEAVTAHAEGAFEVQTQSAERTRLEELLFEWLTEVERVRSVPFEVEDVERELQFVLAGLPLTIRIDRVDRLADGGLALIDYKSGDQTKNKLACPRPREPQLLVYAAAKGDEVEAALFGVLKPRDLRLAGISKTKHVAGQRVSVHGKQWDQEMDAARTEVERIAADFLRGDAAVDPVKDACAYCGITPLCRVKEQSRKQEDCE